MSTSVLFQYGCEPLEGFRQESEIIQFVFHKWSLWLLVKINFWDRRLTLEINEVFLTKNDSGMNDSNRAENKVTSLGYIL